MFITYNIIIGDFSQHKYFESLFVPYINIYMLGMIDMTFFCYHIRYTLSNLAIIVNVEYVYEGKCW
jgi:hypothetical protein